MYKIWIYFGYCYLVPNLPKFTAHNFRMRYSVNSSWFSVLKKEKYQPIIKVFKVQALKTTVTSAEIRWTFLRGGTQLVLEDYLYWLVWLKKGRKLFRHGSSSNQHPPNGVRNIRVHEFTPRYKDAFEGLEGTKWIGNFLAFMKSDFQLPVNTDPLLHFIRKQLNHVHLFKHYCFEMHFKIILFLSLPSILFPWGEANKIFKHSSVYAYASIPSSLT